METTSKKIYRFSRFSSVRSKCAMDTDLEQFMADICSDTYRRQVNRCVGHAYDEKCAPDSATTRSCAWAAWPAVKVFRRRSWTRSSRSKPPATPYPTSTPTTSASG